MDFMRSKRMRQQLSAQCQRYVLVSRYCFYGQRSRTVPRYFPNGRVLNSVREDGGSLRYGSEVSLLVESQLSLDLERLFA